MNIDHELAKISRAVRRLGLREIKTDHWQKPGPSRRFDWSATFDDYDGAPDAGFQPIGYGPTQRDAIIDLLQQDAS